MDSFDKAWFSVILPEKHFFYFIFCIIRQCAELQATRKKILVNEPDEFRDLVYTLSTHPFMDKLVTKVQRKKEVTQCKFIVNITDAC